jgi:GDP-L-fucose synthase
MPPILSEKILVTGASGLIGSALVRQLKARGAKQLFTPTRAELDLRDQEFVKAWFAAHTPAYVFHLAARVGGIHANAHYPADFIYDNTAMHCNVLQSAHRHGVKKLLFPGSACTYPKLAPQPIIEEEFLNGHIEPTNIAYAAAKINGIVMAQSFARQYGMKIVAPMPTNAYGVGDNFNPEASHVIPGLMKRFHEAKQKKLPRVELWGTGSPKREFINSEDVADAFLFLMERYDSTDLINVGTMKEITIRDLAATVAKVVGYEGELFNDTSKPDGAPRKCLDSLKLMALGWQPKVELEEGLRAMYAAHF